MHITQLVKDIILDTLESREERQEVVEQVIERREVSKLSYFIKVPLRPPPEGCRFDPRGKIRTVYPNSSARMTEDNESADVTEDT
uniref:Uncharacterized protein n=1 Tax=Rhodnius prolixus TaxID=13249 RepID=T1IFD8_RHOPR